MPLVRSLRKPLFLPKVAGTAWWNRNAFRDVETYCMFIGHGRSGHSTVAALLDAHPEVVMSRELNIVRFVRAGIPMPLIYGAILRKEERFGRTGYDFSVLGQWQGRVRTLRVIGAKKGPRSIHRLQRDPLLLERARIELGPDLRVIHVVRNPFDNISTMSRRLAISLEAATEQYLTLCGELGQVRSKLGESELYTLRHESFVGDPARHLSDLCAWLGVGASDDYLLDAAKVVFDAPSRTRSEADWTPEVVSRVEGEIAQFDFLGGYSYAD